MLQSRPDGGGGILTKYIFRIAAAFLLAAIASGPNSASAATDEFQRYIKIYNELPIPVFPVITAVESENGQACGTSGVNRRIVVNKDTPTGGVPPNAAVLVNLPKVKHCWYNAVRVYLFTVNLAKFEALIPKDDRTTPDGAVWSPALCGSYACWTGSATAQYPVDAPAQLFEYTAISQNPADGIAFPDPNNPNGIPLVDIDLSYVDSAYLPVATNLDDGGATAYMGTTLQYTDFNSRSKTFIGRTDASVNPLWSEYAAYAPVNWPYTVFNKLVAQSSHVIGRDIVGDIRVIPPNDNPPTSVLYTAPYTGPRECTSLPACYPNQGNCCPTDNGTILACCGAPLSYLISNTSKKLNLVVNPSVDDLVARWTAWVRSEPCANIAGIGKWPSSDPAFSKADFCRDFRSSVNYVWETFYNSKDQVDKNGNPIPYTGCVNYSGVARDRCTVDAIVAFKSNDKGTLNESVQALMRAVPYTVGNPRWSFDKFILNWAPYDSVFNLFPYVRFIHNATDGVDAPGAYAFSIDDRYGNYQNRASGFLIDVGGSKNLLNKTAYDFWEQYRVAFAAGWDHATVCGRAFTFPNAIGSNAAVSFWQNGVAQSSCEIVFYTSKGDHANFQVGETSKSVTDTYTGLKQTVTELTYDPAYCKQNSSASLVGVVCTNSKLVPTLVGEGDDPGEAYVSLTDAEKPLVTLTLPAP